MTTRTRDNSILVVKVSIKFNNFYHRFGVLKLYKLKKAVLNYGIKLREAITLILISSTKNREMQSFETRIFALSRRNTPPF